MDCLGRPHSRFITVVKVHMHRDSTSVVHACVIRYFHIVFIHMKFDIAFLNFMVMSLLKLSSLSSVPLRYLTSGLSVLYHCWWLMVLWISSKVEPWSKRYVFHFFGV